MRAGGSPKCFYGKQQNLTIKQKIDCKDGIHSLSSGNYLVLFQFSSLTLSKALRFVERLNKTATNFLSRFQAFNKRSVCSFIGIAIDVSFQNSLKRYSMAVFSKHITCIFSKILYSGARRIILCIDSFLLEVNQFY